MAKNSQKNDDKPRWICRDRRDQQSLKNWTLEQLDLMDEQSYQYYLAREMADDVEEAAVQHLFKPVLPRIKILTAITARDAEALSRLTADIELRRFAFEKLLPKRVGRPSGSSRWKVEEDILKEAASDVGRIKKLWEERYGRKNRGPKSEPTAVGIAAERWKIQSDSLKNFMSNRRRGSA